MPRELPTATPWLTTDPRVDLKPASAPHCWGPTRAQRTTGLAGVLLLLPFAVFGLGDDFFESLVLFAAALYVWPSEIAQVVHWQVLADRSGLWLTGPWRIRHVPWEAVQQVHADSKGVLTIRTATGTWRTEGAFPKRSGIPAALRAAMELTALQEHPDLRPTLSASRWKLLPLAPFVALLDVALAVWSPFG